MSTSIATNEPNSGASFNVNTTTQYAGKKRRRPQAKKDKTADKENAKSNPSKRHRDRLNNELDELAQLIPFPEEVLNKLDKLSILRLVVSYLRNKNYHAAEDANNFENELNQLLPFLPDSQVACLQEAESNLALAALHGFLIVVTQDFNIFYVTESVQEYLGFPQSDMMNLSMLDFVHVDDREIFMRQMRVNQKDQPASPPEDGQPSVPEYVKMGMTSEEFKGFSQDGFMHRSFICRLRCLPDTSSGFLALHFTGHLRLIPGQNKSNEQKLPLPPEMGLFLLASPLQSPSILEIRTKNFIFRTKHKLDYTPLGIDAKGKMVLGYTEQLLRQRSGYEFIHSADMMHCADAHTKLMRLGESGYTVFRLLHKDNRWVWVTASARLVYRHGQPECIIATQRPIQDQEGEEHMKKRNNAFRFDFTGQAVLYGEVNPIGTKGGPENNPLNENMDAPPTSKRQRMIDTSELDRKSLYGAQAMQRMDIYVGNLPNHPADAYASRAVHASAGAVQNLIKNEQVGDHMGALVDAANATFYPMGTEVPQEDQERIMRQQFRNPNNYQMVDHPFQQDFSGNNMRRQQSQGSGMDSRSAQEYLLPQNQPMVHNQPSNQFATSLSGAEMQQQNHLKRPYPNQTNFSPGKSLGDQQPMQFSANGRQMSRENITLQDNTMQLQLQHQKRQQQVQQQQHGQQFQQPLPQQPAYSNFSQTINPVQTNQNFHNSVQVNIRKTDEKFDDGNNDFTIQSYQDDLNGLTAPIPHFNSNNIGQAPSVIDAMTINSVLSVEDSGQPGSSAGNHSQNTNANMQMQNLPTEYDVPLLVGSQKNTIRFDLDKVASDYQTTDPLGKVEQFMRDNPAQAVAIASGLLPSGVPNMPSGKAKGFMQRCQQYQQQNVAQQQLSQQRPFGGDGAQYPVGYPNSIGTNSNSDLLSSYMSSEDEANYRNPSISSVNSMSTASMPRNSSMDGMMAQQYLLPQQYQEHQQT